MLFSLSLVAVNPGIGSRRGLLYCGGANPVWFSIILHVSQKDRFPSGLWLTGQ
jgi:hypothetical protein